MVVVSRKRMTNLLVKVVDTDLLDLEEGRRPLTPAFKSQIDLLWNPCPPSITDTIKEGYGTRPPTFWGFPEPEGDPHCLCHYHIDGHGIWRYMVLPDPSVNKATT